jgi:hypothetical protein
MPVTNAYTESINRLAKDKNREGRGYSFEVMRARMLYTTKHNQVIIGAQLQPLDSVIHAVARGKEQYRCLTSRFTQRLHNAPAIHVGQHDIQHDQVEGLGHRQMVAIETIAHQTNLKSSFSQSLAQIVACFDFVLDHE